MVQNLVKLDVLKMNCNEILLLGPIGEKITNDYDFYAIFESVEEYTLMCRGIALGQYSDNIPDSNTLIFGGLRWKIQDVNKKQKVITVLPAQDGSMPSFNSSGELFFHKRVREKVRDLYLGKKCPAYLNDEAKVSFEEAIQYFYSLNLDKLHIIQIPYYPNVSFWFPWEGDRQTHKLNLLLRLSGLETSSFFGIVSIIGASAHAIDEAIKKAGQMHPDNADLLKIDDYYFQRPEKKYDYLLPKELKEKEYCAFMYES